MKIWYLCDALCLPFLRWGFITVKVVFSRYTVFYCGGKHGSKTNSSCLFKNISVPTGDASLLAESTQGISVGIVLTRSSADCRNPMSFWSRITFDPPWRQCPISVTQKRFQRAGGWTGGIVTFWLSWPDLLLGVAPSFFVFSTLATAF